jgi:hypothetical protein
MHDGVNLVRYDAMTRAITECLAVDECKDIRDKAVALASYMRQRDDVEAERKLGRIRLRAARQCGQLIREMKEADQLSSGTKGQLSGRDSSGGTKTIPPEKQRTLTDLGLTKSESSTFQKIEKIPEADFEEIIADPEQKLTESAVILAWKPKEKHNNPHSLALWGDLRDFERHGLLQEDGMVLFDDMTLPMQNDMRRLVPVIAAYLSRLSTEIARHDEKVRANV